MMKIGFVGLGIMGKPMVRNILKAGYELAVYGHSQAVMDELQAAGAKKCTGAREVAAQSDVVITMVQNSPQVRTAVLGEGGILEGAKSGLIIIDASSIAPTATQEIAAECAKKGVEMLDCPVSGGEPKAIDGSLSFMCGGKKEVFDKVYDLLMTMGGSAVLCGDIGAGNTTKLANQIIVACNIAALSEALVLGKKAGVDPDAIFQAIRGGLAGSAVMDAKAPMMIGGSFNPGFRVELHIKDLNNCLETAHEIGAPLPMTAQVMEMMQWLRSNGHAADDHSALAKYYQSLSGTSLSE